MNGALSAARLRTGLALAAPRSAVPRACANRSRGAGPGGGAGLPMSCRGRSAPRRQRAHRAPPLAFKGRCHLSLKTLGWCVCVWWGVHEVIGVVPGLGALYNEHGLEAELSSTKG